MRPQPNEFMDLTGVPCPANAAKALIRMATMDHGEILEIIIDEGEPIRNVPAALEVEGHEILDTRLVKAGSWSLLIKVGS